MGKTIEDAVGIIKSGTPRVVGAWMRVYSEVLGAKAKKGTSIEDIVFTLLTKIAEASA